MNNAEQYLELFGELENRLRMRAGIKENYVEFHSLVNSLVRDKKDRVVTQYERELKDYAALRNAIAHRYSKEPIADPRQDAIDNLREISNKLLNPQRAKDIMTANPMSFQLERSLKECLAEMSSFGYTSVPVYEDGQMIGIFSEQVVLKWVSDSIQADGVILVETKDLASIREYLTPIEGGDTEIYTFVKRDLDVFTIQDKFDEAIKQKKRLAAVFVTQNGKPSEHLDGIITAWDLYRIK